MPENFEEVYKKWKDGQGIAKKALDVLGLKRTTFYEFVKRVERVILE